MVCLLIDKFSVYFYLVCKFLGVTVACNKHQKIKARREIIFLAVVAAVIAAVSFGVILQQQTYILSSHSSNTGRTLATTASFL